MGALRKCRTQITQWEEEKEASAGKEPLPVEKFDVYSRLWESTGFLADLTLRLPDSLHRHFRIHPNDLELARWAHARARASLFDHAHTLRLLNLMGQELEFDAHDPTYVNPFLERVSPESPASSLDPEKLQRNRREELRKKRKERLRQPRLSTDL